MTHVLEDLKPQVSTRPQVTRDARAMRWSVEIAATICVLIVSVSYGRYLDFHRTPFEDAAMIMRYADHVAHGYGAVWNIGDPPVDGATDFLFMMGAAVLIKAGASAEAAVRNLALGAHFATALLIYWVNRRIWKAPVVVALICSWYFAASTGLAYVAAYFGTPVFALAATVAWSLALKIIRDKQPSRALSMSFALASLVTGLIRPEGVILTALMAISVVLVLGWRSSIRVVSSFAAVFLTLGSAYFAWRWWYFGYPLPNPYYKKGAGHVHWESLEPSLMNLLGFARPFLPLFLLGFRSPAR